MANYSSINVTEGDDDRSVDAAMATVYGIICLGGLVGHALVLLVIVRDRHQTSHAVSNSYIASLSAADIGFLLGLPFVITTLAARRCIFGITLCKVPTEDDITTRRLGKKSHFIFGFNSQVSWSIFIQT